MKIKNFYQFRELFYLYMVFDDDEEFIPMLTLENALKEYLMFVGVDLMTFNENHMSNGTRKCHELDELIAYFNINNYI